LLFFILESAKGRQILKERPKVNSEAVDMDRLSQFPEGSFGLAYYTWLQRCGVTLDTHELVRIRLPNSKSIILFTQMMWRKSVLH
jgi:ubiquinone biosynthesis protein Coq4